MSQFHPAIKQGGLAVIAGSSSGIGLALAKFYAKAGMSVAMGDMNGERLARAEKQVQEVVRDGARTLSHEVDVGDEQSVRAFKEAVLKAFPETPLSVLHANAGVGGKTSALDPSGWERILSTNFRGVVNVCATFVPHIQQQQQQQGKSGASLALVVATGSKQGITCPPATGVAYNMSKGLVKIYAEQLAHELRQDDKSAIDVKLLIPGWVWTALTGADEKGEKPKPDGAWTPEQTVEYFQKRAAQGSFYIVCPDGETTEAHDKARMEWSAMDVVEDRPPLSRWEKDYTPKYEAFMKSKGL